MKLEYDIPVEVKQNQYRRLVKYFPGIIAHRRSEGKYYIKLWDMRFKKIVEKLF